MSSEAPHQADSVPIPVPDVSLATVAIPAPGDGSGYWAGGPSAAAADDGTVWLAYRLRRPIGEGRGYAVGIARSDDGGETFTEVHRLERDAFSCDSLERPALVRKPEGGWRIYLSLATPGTLHWSVVAIDADDPTGFEPQQALTVLDLGVSDAVKDTVVHPGADGWEMWVCLHEIAEPEDADAMITLRATSPDGLEWHTTGTVLLPHDPSGWDARGTRVAAVVEIDGGRVAYYDGRASFEENWEERTGLAVEAGDHTFIPVPGGPQAVSPHGSGSLRYVDVLVQPDGFRLYFEAARPDGAHDLLTQFVPLPGA